MKERRLNKLNPEEYSLAGEVLGELDIHLAVQALLDGDSPEKSIWTTEMILNLL